MVALDDQWRQAIDEGVPGMTTISKNLSLLPAKDEIMVNVVVTAEHLVGCAARLGRFGSRHQRRRW